MAFHIVQRLDDGRLPAIISSSFLFLISLRVKGYLSPLKAFEAAAAAGQNGKELGREDINLSRRADK